MQQQFSRLFQSFFLLILFILHEIVKTLHTILAQKYDHTRIFGPN